MNADDIIPLQLIPDAADALNQVELSKGYSKTDAVNWSVQLAALVQRKLDEGFRLAFVKVDHRGGTSDLEVVDLEKDT